MWKVELFYRSGKHIVKYFESMERAQAYFDMKEKCLIVSTITINRL
ncbi:hypothetical protein ADMFC3_27820 [Geovibrio sp. ADMFC3]|jgi:hypothetical protein